jgi:hypothetical protein
MKRFCLLPNYVEKKIKFYAKFIFLYKQKSNIYHSIEVCLKISTNKLKERTAIKLSDPTPKKTFFVYFFIHSKNILLQISEQKEK